MHSSSRLVMLFGLPALLLAMVSLAAWLALGSGETGFGPMRLNPLPSPSAATDPAAVDAPPTTQLERLSPLEAKLRNALLPYSRLPRGAAFAFRSAGGLENDALECLTQAIYYEAGRESEIGKRAVAQVIVNRASSLPFPSTICGVVQQGAPRPGCQFTFMCDGSLGRRPDAALWADARRVAGVILSGETEPSVGDATHYHADYVFPVWAPTMEKRVQIGAHIFYRWRSASPRPLEHPTTEPIPVAAPPPLETVVAELPRPETVNSARDASSTSAKSGGEAASSGEPKQVSAATVSTQAIDVAPSPLAKPIAPEVRDRPRRAIPERSLRGGPF